ncbi:MAG: hypothetical protein U1U88_001937, partial [Lawsonella clevelandensis]
MASSTPPSYAQVGMLDSFRGTSGETRPSRGYPPPDTHRAAAHQQQASRTPSPTPDTLQQEDGDGVPFIQQSVSRKTRITDENDLAPCNFTPHSLHAPGGQLAARATITTRGSTTTRTHSACASTEWLANTTSTT